jgi:hypothetical protein
MLTSNKTLRTALKARLGSAYIAVLIALIGCASYSETSDASKSFGETRGKDIAAKKAARAAELAKERPTQQAAPGEGQ